MRYRPLLAVLASLAFACADPGPDTAGGFDAFVGSLEQEPDTGAYIVDGDLAVDSDKRLRDVYEAMREGGRPDLMAGSAGWGPERRHRLTYCVSAGLGERHGAVVAAMAEASAEWEASADVHFEHVAAQDGACDAAHTGVLFDVGGVEGVSYVARSFFPTASRAHRSVRLADAAFDGSLPLRAILAHQLGHALGLANAGCDASGVMQDLECAAGDLRVTEADAARAAAGRRRAERQGAAEVDTAPPLSEALFFGISRSVFAVAALALCFVFFGTLTGLLFVRKESARIALGVAAPLSFVLFVVAGAGLAIRGGWFEDGERAVVLPQRLVLREGPGEDATERHRAAEGERAWILETREDWVRVRVPTVGEGWAPSDAIGAVRP